MKNHIKRLHIKDLQEQAIQICRNTKQSTEKPDQAWPRADACTVGNNLQWGGTQNARSKIKDKNPGRESQ